MQINKMNATMSCLLLTALAACGGGGGGGSSSTATTPPASAVYNLQAATTYNYEHGQSVNFTAAQTGNSSCSGSGSYQITPITSSATFGSTAALSGSDTITINWTNCTPTSTIIADTLYINTSSTAPLGFTTSSSYGVYSNVSYPTSVAVGETGSLGSVQLYSDSTKSTPIGSETTQYSISAGTSSNSVTVTETVQRLDTSNNVLVTETVVGQLSSTGVLTFTSITINDVSAGDTITLTAN